MLREAPLLEQLRALFRVTPPVPELDAVVERDQEGGQVFSGHARDAITLARERQCRFRRTGRGQALAVSRR